MLQSKGYCLFSLRIWSVVSSNWVTNGFWWLLTLILYPFLNLDISSLTVGVLRSRRCLMSHQYPNGPSAEWSRRRRAWQRSRTPNKRVDSGNIEGRQKEKNRIRSIVKFEPGSDKCRVVTAQSDWLAKSRAIRDAIKRRHLLINILLTRTPSDYLTHYTQHHLKHFVLCGTQKVINDHFLRFNCNYLIFGLLCCEYTECKDKEQGKLLRYREALRRVHI